MNRFLTLCSLLLALPAMLIGRPGPAAERTLVRSAMQLANNAVLTIYQDEAGNLWVGTYDGLHLYNGKETFVYRMELDNDQTLSSNIVLRIIPAEAGYLWIATSLGINKFSIDTRRVTESYLMESVETDNIVSDPLGNTLLFAADHAVRCFRRGEPTFSEVAMPGLLRADIAAVWAATPGCFDMVTRSGLLRRYRMKLSGTVGLQAEGEVRISERPIRQAACCDDELCFIDDDGTLWRYDCRTRLTTRLADLSALGERGLTASALRTVGEEIYIGFFGGGLGRVPRDGGTCELLASDYRVFCLWPDRYQDILWVGTDGYGAFMYCDKHDPFTTLHMNELPQRVLKPVRALHTERDGSLWIGTKGGGIIRIRDYAARNSAGELDRDYRARTVSYDKHDGLSSNEVFAFCRSTGRDVLWIGTSGPGLSYFDLRRNTIRTLTTPADQPAIRNVHEICETDPTTLFVACDTEGLVELSIGGGERPTVRAMRRYRFRRGDRDCNEFYAMIRESDTTLLLGLRGGYGLVRFNIRTKDYGFIDMKLLQRRAVGDLLSLCRSRSSGLYCGASSGLIHLTSDGGIRQYDRRDGIANDMIHGVLEDTHGCIWLSTNKGLAQYNPRTESFHNYAAPDLGVTEFCDDAYWRCPYTGRLFFGGVDGIVWIDPSEESPVGYRPMLQFTGLEFPDGSMRPLPRRRETGYDPVRIGPHTPRFTVTFVAADYLNGENFEYSCRLDGEEGSWIELQKDNRVTLSDLEPGTHRLDVRYKSNVTDEVDTVYSLPIVVLPPWYRTTAALVVFALLGAGLLAFGIATLRRHYRRQQQRLVARLEEEARERLTEARVNFFVNISHELCTPLTLINGMNERLAAAVGDDPGLRKFTEVMRENVRNLNDLIQEIIDFRKIEEAGFGRVRIRPVELAGLLATQIRSFADAAARNGITLTPEVDAELVWNTDASFLKKIVLNLLSNAMKYTPPQGHIRVTAAVSGEVLRLSVWNSGRGIEPGLLTHIFDRYRVLDSMDQNMYTDSASRNGLGLFICHGLVEALGGKISVRSEVGAFTEFTVTLPTREAEAPEKEEAALTPRASEPDRLGEKPLVLAVDDNRDMLWLIESAFSPDCRVTACRCVDEALTALGEAIPDLIVTDIVMSGPNGLDLIAKVRNDKLLRNVPIIVVSAKVTEGEQIEALQAGSDAYLTKPFSVEVLRATAARLISNRTMLKEYYNTPESAYTVVEGHKMHRTDKAFMDAVAGVVHELIESEELRIEQVAERLGLSPRNFSRKLKQVSGRTPSEFIKEMRFEYAARLLKTTQWTIQEIMYRVGISNKSYFYREFQRKYGVKPKTYRQQP